MAEITQDQQFDSKDVEQNKVMAIIGYIFPIIFFIPLVSDASKSSPYAKFHANQQLILLLFAVVGYFASGILTLAFIGILLFPLVGIASLVFMIMGILNAVSGLPKKLPVIGGFTLIK